MYKMLNQRPCYHSLVYVGLRHLHLYTTSHVCSFQTIEIWQHGFGNCLEFRFIEGAVRRLNFENRLCFEFQDMGDNIFDSPQTIKGAIGREVRIKTRNGIDHKGFVYTIDPQTETVVLTDNLGAKVAIIPQHAIKNIVLGQNFVEKFAVRTETNKVQTTGVLEEKKKNLVKWLKDNLIEVVEDGDLLRISDYVSIEPPYDIDHCYCTNTVILERLQNIIKRMPD